MASTNFSLASVSLRSTILIYLIKLKMKTTGKLVCMLLGVGFLGGCAVPTTGVVPRGEGLHTVTRQGEGFWITPDALKAAAIQEADAYCHQSGKQVKVIHTKEIPAGALGRWPESEVLFLCE